MIDIILPSNSDVHKWTLDELKSKDLVFDGGDDNTEPLTEPVSKKKNISHGGHCAFVMVNCMWLIQNGPTWDLFTLTKMATQYLFVHREKRL